MKKVSFRKITALFIAMIMVLGLLPVSVFAEGSLDLDADEIVINTADDWKQIIAASSNTFEGKTVKLGADIDFAGDAVTQPLFATFKGTFDGQGHTVKNLTVNSPSGVQSGLIARVINGATVKNLTAENVKINCNKSESAILIGKVTGESLIENCTMVDCIGTSGGQSGGIIGSVAGPLTVRNCHALGNTSVGATDRAGIGVIVGKINAGAEYVVVDSCTVAETVTITILDSKGTNLAENSKSFAESMGLIIGQIGQPSHTTNPAKISTRVEVKNCVASGTIVGDASNKFSAGALIGIAALTKACTLTNNKITNVTISNGVSMGGVIGKLFFAPEAPAAPAEGEEATPVEPELFTVDGLTVEGLTIQGGGNNQSAGIAYVLGATTGDVVIKNVSANVILKEGVGTQAGIVGKNCGVGSIAIENCYVKGTMSTAADGTKEDAYFLGGVVGKQESGSITVNNAVVNAALTTVATGTANAVCGKKLEDGELNATNCSAITEAFPTAGVAPISAEQAEKLVTLNEQGYVASVAAHVNVIDSQTSALKNGKYAVRFIGSSLMYEGTVKVTVVATYEENGQQKERTFVTDCTLYDALNGSNEFGIDAYLKTTEDLGVLKFFAYTITNVPDMNCEFVVSVSYADVDGASYTLNYVARA